MRVLIVEDEEVLGRAIFRFFHMSGHEPVLVKSAEDGWKMFEENVMWVDAVLSDNDTGPGRKGIELLIQLKKDPMLQHLRLALMSGRDDAFASCAENGIKFLYKPFGLAELNTAMSR